MCADASRGRNLHGGDGRELTLMEYLLITKLKLVSSQTCPEVGQ